METDLGPRNAAALLVWWAVGSVAEEALGGAATKTLTFPRAQVSPLGLRGSKWGGG